MKQPFFWLALTLTLVAISILVNLGFWQLSRAEQKQLIQSQLDINSRQDWQSLNTFINRETDVELITGSRVVADLTPMEGRYVLLDNQVFEGEVGYLALQLMETELGQYVLLERGFIAGTDSRSQLPPVEWLTEEYQGRGRLYVRSNNPLSDALMLEQTSPARIQNLNLKQLGEAWQLPLEHFVFQPQQEGWIYPQPWRPVPMNDQKHIGYAVQWFAMAMALTVLGVIWLRKALRSSTKESL
ncbi:SURF1 family protein [Vibrio sp. 404]|uniref:SURF1-like protein n=1 Tax=Vibrio marinisediminis TaxID=2758441 RepID=A0A7W2FNU7_9VIBR|nr:SURF1 family protein [Vibrio marinisediminis]MBA5761548.1 SURF1 family protein [Vibrio marinisediminis]